MKRLLLKGEPVLQEAATSSLKGCSGDPLTLPSGDGSGVRSHDAEKGASGLYGVKHLQLLLLMHVGGGASYTMGRVVMTTDNHKREQQPEERTTTRRENNNQKRTRVSSSCSLRSHNTESGKPAQLLLLLLLSCQLKSLVLQRFPSPAEVP
ncbi:hypothetical protein EYF80_055779 [Liparis tanakae]|uniref:Uncharacterized protein n=1 Tax=Liparis tanakae TaxID=230148 RepID=A0A4Z2EZW3_9TELE|nr:hypothetical protein EYF80_055779 [Liparis tanakae]